MADQKLIEGVPTCGKEGCVPGVCAHPDEGCSGTQLLDYVGKPITGFSQPKVPAHPPVEAFPGAGVTPSDR